MRRVLPDVVDCAGALGERRLRRASGEAQVHPAAVAAIDDADVVRRKPGDERVGDVEGARGDGDTGG